MKILHYFLGFPPWRSGGMTKFCTDLMKGQLAEGEMVYALWPGRSARKTKILSRGKEQGIPSFEITGPLPVPLDEGVYDPAAFMKPCDQSVYVSFLDRIGPDVIHVHTLMGLHWEFSLAAAEKKIPIVYTAHDYFGICPKVTLFRHGVPCGDDHACADCALCCEDALTPAQIRILQSSLYRKCKDTVFVRLLRRCHRSAFFEENGQNAEENKAAGAAAAKGFRKLRAYYASMFEAFSVIHYASDLARRTAEKYIHPKASVVFPLTHRDILFQRLERQDRNGPVEYAYFGGQRPHKGAAVLLEAFDLLRQEGGNDMVLHVYGNWTVSRPYIRKHSAYSYADLAEVMRSVDAVLVPSVWMETFAFTVPEAVSFSVPVIVSDRVGAAEYIGRAGLVTAGGDASALKETLASLTRERLREMQCASDTAAFPGWESFLSQIRALYGEYAG